MSARPVKPKDPLYGVCLSNSNGKCQVAHKLQFGMRLPGSDAGAIVQVCGRPIEGIFWQEDNVGMIAMCKPCRLHVFGMTSAEKRKRTVENKAAQTALVVRDKDKP